MNLRILIVPYTQETQGIYPLNRHARTLPSSLRSLIMAQENVIFVGNKPIMNYVLACLTLLHGGTSEVHMKARGRAISTAVDVAEVLRNRFMTDLAVKSVDIGTEVITSQDGTKRNVSTITINLLREAAANKKPPAPTKTA